MGYERGLDFYYFIVNLLSMGVCLWEMQYLLVLDYVCKEMGVGEVKKNRIGIF